RDSTARGRARVATAMPEALRSWKSAARRSRAALPTPITAASMAPAAASAPRSSSPPRIDAPATRSVKPATVHPHSTARSPPAPTIKSRLATGALAPARGKDRAPLSQEQLGEEEVPLRVDVHRGLEVHDDAAVVVAQDVPVAHQGLVARHVHRARGLIDGRG